MEEDAIFFMVFTEKRHTNRVRISEAGWEKYIPLTPIILGRTRMNRDRLGFEVCPK